MEHRHSRAIRNSDEYLNLPSEQDVLECHRAFYDATGDAALAAVVCAVCGRETSITQDGGSLQKLVDMSNRNRLVPHESHPCHTLFDGCLLEGAGVRVIEGELCIWMCKCCRDDLDMSALEIAR